MHCLDRQLLVSLGHSMLDHVHFTGRVSHNYELFGVEVAAWHSNEVQVNFGPTALILEDGLCWRLLKRGLDERLDSFMELSIHGFFIDHCRVTCPILCQSLWLPCIVLLQRCERAIAHCTVHVCQSHIESVLLWKGPCQGSLHGAEKVEATANGHPNSKCVG